MAKQHLKTIAAPNTWAVRRKKNKFMTRPKPGAHKMRFGMPLSTVMTDLIKCAKTKREARIILNNKNLLVDGKKRKDTRHIIGLMDTISIKETGENYRLLLNSRGKLTAVRINDDEASIKPSRIKGKTKISGGVTQLNTMDGRAVRVKKDDYKVGDTIMLSLPGQEIKEHIRLEKGSTAYMIGGKHIGDTGKVQDVEGRNIRIKSDQEYETLKSYAFAIGKDKPAVSMGQGEQKKEKE
ncbi:MAG: 30S ribosomal protein S4e [Candidatus Woesearchaeota archaeon]